MELSVFDRLRGLLGGALVNDSSIALHLGELQAPIPREHLAPLLEHADGWGRYPPLSAISELQEAYRAWLLRRFPCVQETLSGWRMEQTPGSKQALAASIALAVQRARERGVSQPVVILPNPFYPTCPVAGQVAGALVCYYDSMAASGPISAEQLLQAQGGRACALIVCSPSNPGGDVVPRGNLRRLIELASRDDVDLIIDECYVDLGLDAGVPGSLQTIADCSELPNRWMVLHTLSKRSAVPGLRCGWMLGSEAAVEDYARFNRSCGVSPPVPVALVAAKLWGDDDRLNTLRSAIACNWAMAERWLGHLPGFRRPAAGFFLWFPVDDDEDAAIHLWQQHSLSVMPGRYLARPGSDGINPGQGNIRIALVHPEPVMREALTRLAQALPTLGSSPPCT